MRRIRLGPTPLAVECLNAHQAHQPANVPAANAVAAEPKHVAQHPSASKGIIRMKPADQAHQRKVGLRDRHRHVVQGASRELQQLRLMRERQSVVAIDHRFALDPSIRPSARSKKSFSNAS